MVMAQNIDISCQMQFRTSAQHEVQEHGLPLPVVHGTSALQCLLLQM